MQIKLSEIAEKTGFSINTVSRALRDDKKLSDATCKKIKKTADELGYIPNYIARSMRSNTTHILGVISADSSNPFFAEVILGIEETARKHGYHIFLMNTEEKAENECEAIKTLQGRQVDGLISIPLYDDPSTLAVYKSLSVPFVFAGRKVCGLESHSILHRDKESTEEMVRHLLDNGHEKIMYLTGPDRISNSLERLCGYVNAYKNTGHELDKSLIVKTAGHIDDGYGAVNIALKMAVEFTAVVCFNDLVAMGVLKALHEHNLAVPDDIEVAGCDNLSISQYMQPRLSTIEVPKYKLGEEAVLEVIRHIEQSNLPYETKNLDTRLIFRESTTNRHIHS